MDNLSTFFLTSDPFQSFNNWMEEAKKLGESYDQFVLATCRDNKPSTRVVLLKEMRKDGAVFFTNYASKKGRDIAQNSNVSLVFWWPKLGRQVRIDGEAQKIPEVESEKYFHSRDKSSQVASYISVQSSEIKDRAELESKFTTGLKKFEHSVVPKPEHWGGYLVTPNSWEFFIYREHRLNDRIEFFLKNNSWTWRRLSP